MDDRTDNKVSLVRDGVLSDFNISFQDAPMKMHAIDKNGVLVEVSQFWADRLGYTRDEMIGRKSVEFLTPESQEHAKDVLREFFRTGQIYGVEYDFVRKDGTILPVVMAAVAQNDADGNFLHSIAVMFNNSEAREARARLAQKHRMEAVGRLAGGVAHDFNNILMVIAGNLEVLESHLEAPDLQRHLDDALAATRRGSHLVRQLMSYGQRIHLKPRRLDLNVVVRDTDSMLRRLIPENMVFKTISQGALGVVRLDRNQLEMALLNLVMNAKDAMRGNGSIEIETANVDLGEGEVEELTPGRYVMLSVRDEGPGMSEQVLSKAFEPFYTTKPAGLGSGLGLAMVLGFVHQSMGGVKLISAPEQGTEVRMYFPAVEGAPEIASAETLHVENLPVQDIDVLVVEDEADVRRVIVHNLASQGFRITEAENGDAAVALMDAGYLPRVVVTDMVMPGKFQGSDLGRKAREHSDDVRVLYISGYPKDQDFDTGHAGELPDADGQSYLLKPVSRNELIGAIERLLKD